MNGDDATPPMSEDEGRLTMGDDDRESIAAASDTAPQQTNECGHDDEGKRIAAAAETAPQQTNGLVGVWM